MDGVIISLVYMILQQRNVKEVSHTPERKVTSFTDPFQMEGVPLEVLWCQCRGNASATPQFVLVHQQVQRIHEEATTLGVWYVATTLTLYVLGVLYILARAGTLGTGAFTSLSYCCSEAVSSALRR